MSPTAVAVETAIKKIMEKKAVELGVNPNEINIRITYGLYCRIFILAPLQFDKEIEITSEIEDLLK